MKGRINMRAISSYLNILVGLFMILLGIHGIYGAFYGLRSDISPSSELSGDYSMETENLLLNGDGDSVEKDDLLEYEDASREARFAKHNVAIDLEYSEPDANGSCDCFHSCSCLKAGINMDMILKVTCYLCDDDILACIFFTRLERPNDTEFSFVRCGNTPRNCGAGYLSVITA